MRCYRTIALVALLSSLAAGCADDPPECGLEGASCEELADARDRLTMEFRGLLEAERYSELAPVSGCVQEAVTAQLADEHMCGLTVCGEICRLHPCETPAYEDCVALCQDQSGMPGLGPDALRAILLAAARTPELCTCDICTEESFGFCQALWGCNGG